MIRCAEPILDHLWKNLLTFLNQVDVLCTQLEVGKPVTMRVHPKDGPSFDIRLLHTFNDAQLEWFKNGSALNTMAKKAKA
jgi:aconitate hydratase